MVAPDAYYQQKNGVALPPHMQRERVWTGTVVAVGPGARDDSGTRSPSAAIAAGDRVVYDRRSVDTLDDENVLIPISAVLFSVDEKIPGEAKQAIRGSFAEAAPDGDYEQIYLGGGVDGSLPFPEVEGTDG